MIRRSLLPIALIVAHILAARNLLAQTILLPPGAAYPAAKSTAVNPDRSITFRLSDPAAKSVLLFYDLSPTPVPMRRDPTGLWSFTSAPLAPEIYAYHLTVDGEPRLDPSNRRINEVAIGAVSQSIEVPGDTPQPWDLAPIPHGDLIQRRYTTRIAKGLSGDQSSYLVYTPPGFDPRSRRKYPVLYLLHGYSQLETGWRDLHANLILDTLIAQRKAVPMIVVMPLTYGDLGFLEKGLAAWQDHAAVTRNTDLFRQVLIEEIIPQVESTYPVSTDRKDRAIAGLSMGGLEALVIGLNDTARFSAIAGLSSAVPTTGYQTLFPNLAARPSPNPKTAPLTLLWVACGKDDSLLQANRNLAAYLKQQSLPASLIETPGAHNGFVWRDNLVHLALLLFRK